jgi:hypothetical protein
MAQPWEVSVRSTKAGAALVVAALWTMACGAGAPGPIVHEHHSVDRGTATRARVEIDMSAGDLAVKSGTTKLFEGDFDFNIPVLKPALAYAVNGGTGVLKLSQGVIVEAGAGDTTIHLPAAVGISARTSGLIGDVNVSGLEKRDGRWVNPRAGASSVTVDLQVQRAIGDLKIIAE